MDRRRDFSIIARAGHGKADIPPGAFLAVLEINQRERNVRHAR